MQEVDGVQVALQKLITNAERTVGTQAQDPHVQEREKAMQADAAANKGGAQMSGVGEKQKEAVAKAGSVEDRPNRFAGDSRVKAQVDNIMSRMKRGRR